MNALVASLVVQSAMEFFQATATSVSKDTTLYQTIVCSKLLQTVQYKIKLRAYSAFQASFWTLLLHNNVNYVLLRSLPVKFANHKLHAFTALLDTSSKLGRQMLHVCHVLRGALSVLTKFSAYIVHWGTSLRQ